MITYRICFFFVFCFCTYQWAWMLVVWSFVWNKLLFTFIGILYVPLSLSQTFNFLNGKKTVEEYAVFQILSCFILIHYVAIVATFVHVVQCTSWLALYYSHSWKWNVSVRARAFEHMRTHHCEGQLNHSQIGRFLPGIHLVWSMYYSIKLTAADQEKIKIDKYQFWLDFVK